jgi:hypothetical protein
VVTVADRASDPAGLFPADFDLLTRVNGLEALDVIGTNESLDAGMGDRLREMLPGIEEHALEGDAPHAQRSAPVFFTSRDREDELADVARAVKASRRLADAAPLDRTAVVFKRPLPYVYLAQTVFDSAGIPFQAADALPLAAEPYAAALDLVFSFVGSGFARTSAVALLSCPHFQFDDDGAPVGRLQSRRRSALADAGFEAREERAFAAGLVGPARQARAAADAADELVFSRSPPGLRNTRPCRPFRTSTGPPAAGRSMGTPSARACRHPRGARGSALCAPPIRRPCHAIRRHRGHAAPLDGNSYLLASQGKRGSPSRRFAGGAVRRLRRRVPCGACRDGLARRPFAEHLLSIVSVDAAGLAG